jgi:hypothetical protein
MLMDFSLLPIDLLIVMDLFCKWCVFARSVQETEELISVKIGFVQSRFLLGQILLYYIHRQTGLLK